MRTAVILIATNKRYFEFVQPLVNSIHHYGPEFETFVFTDQPKYSEDFVTVPYPDLGWPDASLRRYHAIVERERLFLNYDNMLYLDIDMVVVSKLDQTKMFSKGITAVLHPGFPDAFDRNPASTAYIPHGHNHPYYQGCLVGGSTMEFLNMCSHLSAQISIDKAMGVMARWHDESHLNRYLLDHPPAVVLSPNYAYPDEKYRRNEDDWRGEVKIRHLEKPDQGLWKNK